MSRKDKKDKMLEQRRRQHTDPLIDAELDTNYNIPITMSGRVNSLKPEKVILAKHQIPAVFADELSDWLYDPATHQMFFNEFGNQERLYTAHSIGTPAERNAETARYQLYGVSSIVYRLVCSLQLPNTTVVRPLGVYSTILDFPNFLHFFDSLTLTFYVVPPHERESGIVYIDETQVPPRIKTLLVLKMLIDHSVTQTDFFTSNQQGDRPIFKTCIDLYIDRNQASKDLYHEDSSKNERVRPQFADDVDYLTLTFLARPGERNRIFKGTSVIPAHKYDCMVTDGSHMSHELCLGMLHGGNLAIDDASCFHSTPPAEVQEFPREINTYAEINKNKQPGDLYPHLVFDRDSLYESHGTDANPAIVCTTPSKISRDPFKLRRLQERLYMHSPRTFIRCHHVDMANSRIPVANYVPRGSYTMLNIFNCTAQYIVTQGAGNPDLLTLLDWNRDRRTHENPLVVNGPSEMNTLNKDIMENSDQGIGKSRRNKKGKRVKRNISANAKGKSRSPNFVILCKKKNINRFKNKLKIKIFIP